jgi:Flp pilus assembly pilin Flp
MRRIAFRIVVEERGAAAIEYAVLVALIVLVIVSAVTSTGGAVNGLYSTFNTIAHAL